MSFRETKCRHFTGIQNKVCEAGISYDTFSIRELPCLARGDTSTCSSYARFTAEELADQERAIETLIKGVDLARTAIVKRADELGFARDSGGRVGKSVRGVIDCPVCKQPSALSFSRTAYNGHVHAACKTANCVRWVE